MGRRAKGDRLGIGIRKGRKSIVQQSSRKCIGEGNMAKEAIYWCREAGRVERKGASEYMRPVGYDHCSAPRHGSEHLTCPAWPANQIDRNH